MTNQNAAHLHQLAALPQQVPQAPPRWRVQHVQTQRLKVALLRRCPTQHALQAMSTHQHTSTIVRKLG
jgi:hypothetical protein